MCEFLEIPLSKGLMARVSPEDYERVSKHKWHANFSATNKGKYYARGWIISDEAKKQHVLLHVFITGERGYDHEDGDPLNCTRPNLRKPPSTGHNNANGKRRKDSGYKGVYPSGSKFVVLISNGSYVTPRTVGRFDNEVEAAKAYDREATAKWGVFASLNFPIS